MDITYVPMAHGFVYLAVVLVGLTRVLLSWRPGRSRLRRLLRRDMGGCSRASWQPEIFQQRQGSQFNRAALPAFRRHGIAISMGWQGAWRYT